MSQPAAASVVLRRILLPLLPAMLLLAACSPGGLFSGDLMYAPHREIPQDPALARKASEQVLSGFFQGEIVLSEAELTNFLRQNWVDPVGPEQVIRDVQVWFEQDRTYLQILFAEGVFPAVPSDVALNLAGRLHSDNDALYLTVDRMGLGVISLLPPDALAPFNDLFTEILRQSTPWAADRVVVDQGQITLRLQ